MRSKKIGKIAFLLSVIIIISLSLTGCQIIGDAVSPYLQDTSEQNKNLILSSETVHNLAQYATATVEVSTFTTVTQGTGFFVSSDGIFITNHHVVTDFIDPSGKVDISIRLYYGDEFSEAEIINYDAKKDIAVLQVDVGEAKVNYLRLKSNGYKKGDNIYVLGTPKGNENTFIEGQILTSNAVVNDIKCIQISAELKNGNSGGPLLTESGAVIGVNTFAIETNGKEAFYAVSITELSYIYTAIPIYSNGDTMIDTPLCGITGHTHDDGLNHVFALCGEEGHYICVDDSHEELPCGHFSCTEGDHTVSACGHFSCDGHDHGDAPCGLYGHTNCYGGSHLPAACGSVGHYTCDAHDHRAALCGLEGHYRCDNENHFKCLFIFG